MTQADLMQGLRDIVTSMSEYAPDWGDADLAEAGNLAARLKGVADTERLVRALGAENIREALGTEGRAS